MRNRVILLPAFLLIATALVPRPGLASELEGVWFRPCWQADLELSTEETLRITGDVLEAKREFSVQPQCGTVDFTFTAKAKIRYDGEGPGPHDIALAWIAGSVQLTPLTNTSASGFNELKACGFTDWRTNVPKNVSGRKCEGLEIPKEGNTYYQIVSVQGGRLRFGYEAGYGYHNASPQTRPRVLDDFNPYQSGVPSPDQRRRKPLIRPR